MVGCPFAEEKGDDFKKEVLIEFHSVLPNLKTINGEDWSKDDLEEMNAEIKAREEAKLEADAEEKEPVEPENDSAVEDSQDEGGNPVPKQTMDEDQLEALRYQFMDMDENKDGKISKLELRKIMKEMGEDYTIKQCNRMIKNVDKDGDGMISFEEFCKSVEAPPEKEEEEAEE
jgi:calcium-binding protein CML